MEVDLPAQKHTDSAPDSFTQNESEAVERTRGNTSSAPVVTMADLENANFEFDPDYVAPSVSAPGHEHPEGISEENGKSSVARDEEHARKDLEEEMAFVSEAVDNSLSIPPSTSTHDEVSDTAYSFDASAVPPLLTILRSDGTSLPPATVGITRYDLVREDDQKNESWRAKLGRVVGPALGLEGDFWVLSSLPTGYGLYLASRPDSSAKRNDTYLVGHPSGHKYRSPNEFAPHAIWLARGDQSVACGCGGCRGKGRVRKSESGNQLGGRRASVSSSAHTTARSALQGRAADGSVDGDEDEDVDSPRVGSRIIKPILLCPIPPPSLPPRFPEPKLSRSQS
ncbi:hypothetical protein BT69DRAFT_761505 [Atractiella rhizophila]|nr:hypothetical protein BT69DRAFT_761505 [Atractiella rhizophila]